MPLQYLFSLLMWHYHNGLSVFFIDRLQNYLLKTRDTLHPADSALICFKCKLIAVPVVNSTVRKNNSVVTVICKTCKTQKTFKVLPIYKNTYIKKTYDINEFLSETY